MPLDPAYRGLLGCESRPMTKDEKVYFGLLELNAKVQGVCLPDALSKDFHYKALTKRLSAHHVRTSFEARLFVTTQCRNPADAVLWAYTMACMQFDRPRGDALRVADVLTPWAKQLPTEAAVAAAWEAQKVAAAEHLSAPITGNWLDVATVWPQFPVDT